MPVFEMSSRSLSCKRVLVWRPLEGFLKAQVSAGEIVHLPLPNFTVLGCVENVGLANESAFVSGTRGCACVVTLLRDDVIMWWLLGCFLRGMVENCPRSGS